MSHFTAILYFATFIVLFRGVTGLLILLCVLDWCSRHKRKYASKKVDSVPLLIVLPLLREQVVYKKMMEYFFTIGPRPWQHEPHRSYYQQRETRNVKLHSCAPPT